MTTLVTGSAGFIGNHVALKLLEQGEQVIGLDNLTPYYDVTLKMARLERLTSKPGFIEARVDLADRDALTGVFEDHQPDRVVNLAAQAGVRYSLEDPHSYVESNLVGFVNLLEACRHFGTKHLVFASSSSVYGANTAMPFSEHQSADHPLSLYAATKKSNEAMAHCYSYLFGIPCSGLRFFTVYGPWGRPDMALFKFTKSILEGNPIDVFNNGEMQRDFTYIDDITEGVLQVLDRPPAISEDWSAEKPDSATSGVGSYRILNIGRGQPVELMKFIDVLETKLGKKAEKNWLPMQAGDVPATWADTTDLEKMTGYLAETSVVEGVSNFVEWYLDYYGINL